MWSLFWHKTTEVEPVAEKACRVSRHYDHRPEPRAIDREADTRAFAMWVLDVWDSDAITRRQVVSLYTEFCEFYELRPMTLGRFDRSLKPSGFLRSRLSTPGRPWVYGIVRPGSALVFKTKPRTIDQRLQQGRTGA